ncbi:MAG: ABC transporter permease subunit [Anaerolineae bacterium]
MNWRAIRTIISKDLKVVWQSKNVMFPLLFVPVLFLVIIPAGGGLLLANTDPDHPEIQETQEELDAFFENLPGSIQAEFDTLENDVQRVIVLIFVYMMAPLYLIVPLMVANVIAADSFVGEKERKTLEALMYTPTTDRELYLAKLIAPWLVAVAVSLVGFVAYGLIINLTTAGVMGGLFFPNLTWIILALWVAPAAAGIGLSSVVLISSRVRTFQEASQLGGLIVVPLILLIIGQLAGVIYFSPGVVFGLGVGLWVVNVGIIAYGAQTFRREALMTRL